MNKKKYDKIYSKQYRKKHPKWKKISNKKWRKENSEYNKKWNEENKKERKEYQKQWREKNPEYSKKHREKHKEELKEYNKEYGKKYREENSEKIKAKKQKYVKENPEKARFKNARRRARKKNAEGSHTLLEWQNLKAECNYICQMCGLREPFEDRYFKHLTEDHIIPLDKNGSDYIENIQPLCHSCNAKKYNKIKKVGGI